MDIVRVTSLDNHKLRLESVAVLPRNQLSRAQRPAAADFTASNGGGGPPASAATTSIGPKEEIHVLVFVGSTDGCITQFSSVISLSEDGMSHVVTSSQTQKRSLESSGEVSFLHADNELRDPRLLALCGGRVIMLHPQTLDQLPIFVNVKGLDGASLMCVSKGTDQRRLAVVNKRSLVLLEYSESSCSPYIGADSSPIALPEGVLQIAWQGNALIVGGKREYVIYDVRHNQIIDHIITEKMLLGPLLRYVDYNGGAIAVRLRQELVLYDGQAAGTLDGATKVSMSEDIADLGFTYPFLVGIKADGRVIVRSILDNFEVSHSHQFGFGQAVRAIASGPLTLFACTNLTLSCAVVTPSAALVSKFLRSAQYERALTHFERTYVGPEDALESARQVINMQCGAHAFAIKRFPEAMKHFADADAPATALIAAVPELARPGTREPSVNKKQQAAASNNSARDEVVIPQTSLESYPAAYSLLYDYIKRRRNVFFDHEAREPSEADRAADFALFYMLVKEAVPLDEEELNALFLPRSALVADECMPLVVETGRNTARFSTLLLASTGQFREALVECQRLQLAVEAVVPLQLASEASLYVEHLPWIMALNPAAGVKSLLVPADRPCVASEAVLPLLLPYRGLPLMNYLSYLTYRRGVRDERVHTLHAINMIEMVTTLIPFCLGSHLQQGLASAAPPGEEEGLLGDTRRELLRFLSWSTAYDADKVLARLHASNNLFDEQVAVYTREKDYASALLVYIYKKKDIVQAERYCLENDECTSSSSWQAAQRSSDVTSDVANDSCDSSHSALQRIDSGGLPSALMSRSFTEQQQLDVQRPRALSIATPNSSFGRPDDDQMSQPLGGSSSGAAPRVAFSVLLGVMLRSLLVPPEGETQRTDDAIQLLDRQSALISPVSALEALPSDVCVAQVQTYLTRVFQAAAHESSMLAVQAQASRAVTRGFEKQRTLLTQRSVFVDDERKCCVCQKKLGDAVFGVFPNLRVAHFRCFKDKELDPVRGVPFRFEK